jgi:hypothetical protein
MTIMTQIPRQKLSINVKVTQEERAALLSFCKALKIKVKLEEEVPTKEAFLAGLQEAIEEVKLHKAGKIELQSLTTKEEVKTFLNGL